MILNCTHMATVAIKGLNSVRQDDIFDRQCRMVWLTAAFSQLHARLWIKLSCRSTLVSWLQQIFG